MISAKVVADSIYNGNRITTLELVMPRIILAEFNTHRMISKNSASSRAIPFNKTVEMVENNPFVPIAWQKHHKGMQGNEYLIDEHDIEVSKLTWLDARDEAVSQAKRLYDCGVTKQLCNRLLEPFMYHKVLCTATEWENFFVLRCPQYEFGNSVFRSKKDSLIKIEEVLGESDFNNTSDYLQWATINKGQAEIHMMVLAEAIWDTMNESTPRELNPGEWHIPYWQNIEPFKVGAEIPDTNGETILSTIIPNMIRISTAMAARTSYTTVGDEKEISFERLVGIHDKMITANPFHASPFEHCARAMSYEEFKTYFRGKAEDFDSGVAENSLIVTEASDSNFGWCRNFKGWIQYRELIEN